MGSPSTWKCFSVRCQPRGRTSRTAVFSLSRYCFPSGPSKLIVRRLACIRFRWPSIMLELVGELASSKSAINMLAPELRALMTILRSVGPVISVRRSLRSAGIGATVQSDSRMCCVSARKSGSAPSSISCCRTERRSSRAMRRASNLRCSSTRNVCASGERISASLRVVLTGFDINCDRTFPDSCTFRRGIRPFERGRRARIPRRRGRRRWSIPVSDVSGRRRGNRIRGRHRSGAQVSRTCSRRIRKGIRRSAWLQQYYL